MARREKDEEREVRIQNEAIVDAHGPEEQAMGWYYFLESEMAFPFKAHCIRERTISPLRKGEEIVVESMAPEDDCRHEIFVMGNWGGRSLGLPLSQLDAEQADESTVEAIRDWHYWVDRGYEFG